MLGTLALASVAGMLSVLNPCVLPLIPIVLGAAAAHHRLGPLALAGGVALSSTVVGLFVALIGFSIGLDTELFRGIAAVLLVAIGSLLVVPTFQARFAVATGPVVGWAEHRFAGFTGAGLAGQFSVGLLLGAVWVPCSGPTIGAASLLASQGENLGQVGLTMLAFGIAAATPLAALGMLSRTATVRWRDRLAITGRGMRTVFGAILIVLGGLILTGLDRVVERALVEASPDWLIDVTTRF